MKTKSILFKLIMSASIAYSLGCSSKDNSTDDQGNNDNTLIAYSITPPGDNNEIWIMDENGNNPTKLTTTDGRAVGPDWSPDGTQIAFFMHHDDINTLSIYVMNSDGSNIVRLTDSVGVWDNSPVWSPDGSQIAFAREGIGIAEIWLMDPDGENKHKLESVVGGGPEWSPDGEKIAYYSDQGGNFDIYIMNPDGTGQTQITSSEGIDIWPCWSPDGTRIVFSSDRDGNYEIYSIDIDGSNSARLTNNNGIDTSPDCSFDGEFIAFVSDRDGSFEIYKMNTDGTNQIRLTTSNVHAIHPDWKPL